MVTHSSILACLGKDYPLQYSGLENSMDYANHGITKSQTLLSDFHFHFYFIALCRYCVTALCQVSLLSIGTIFSNSIFSFPASLLVILLVFLAFHCYCICYSDL